MDEKMPSGIDTPEPNLKLILCNFIGAAKRLGWIVVLLAVLVGALGYYTTDRNYRPLYSSSAVFSVTATYTDTNDLLSYKTYLSISAASNLAATFPYIISSDTARELLRQKLQTTEINATVTAKATADAALFTLTSQSRDPQAAFDVLLATVEIYPHAASSIIGDTQIQIITLPTAPPATPSNQNSASRQGLIFAFVTLLLGFAGIYLLSMSRKTVHTAEDLHRLINLKCLGYVPWIRQKKHSRKVGFRLLVTDPHVATAFSESIRNLRVKLLRQASAIDARAIMVTSTLPNEGKSTIAANLALSLAAEGKRVILVDGDLRKQTLKSAFGLKAPSDGLVDILSGKAQNFRLLTVPNSTLLLLSGNKISAQPQVLLDSDKMRQLMELLRSKLDYIIIDSPPAGILSDAATLVKYVDGTLYVVRQGLANAGQIQDTIQSLSADGVELLGCVLNCTQANLSRYGYGGKYGGYADGYRYSSAYADRTDIDLSHDTEP